MAHLKVSTPALFLILGWSLGLLWLLLHYEVC